jgi:hypothetical protein
MIEIVADPGLLEHPDDALLLDIKGTIPLAADLLAVHGFRVAVDGCTALLLVRPLPASSAHARRDRLDAVNDVLSVAQALESRNGRDLRVDVAMTMRIGSVVMSHGNPISGSLLRLSWWASSEPVPGVVGSAGVFADLNVAIEAILDAPDMFRIAQPTR